MPRLKSAKDLKELCVGSVVQNMDKLWSANYRENYVQKNGGRFSFIEGPFNALDSKCIKQMIKKLATSERITKMYLHLLIVPSLKEIDFSDFSKLITDEIIDLVCIRCRNVTKLEIPHCSRVSSGALKRLVQSFCKSLITVSFVGNKVNDEVLETIGNSCEKLQILCVDGCKFTSQGIEKLLFTGPDRSLTIVGRNLQALRMMGCSFSGDSHVIMDILLNCPSLRCVTHFCMWESIAKICEQSQTPTALKLTGVRYDMPLDMWALQDHIGVFRSIPKCIPHIQHLSIHSAEGMEMSLYHLLTGCGKTLHSLKLDWCLPYEFFNFIGIICPELDTFSVMVTEAPSNPSDYFYVRQAFENYISSHNLKVTNKHPWGKLKQLSIYYPTDPLPFVPSSSILMNIFKNAAAFLSFIVFHRMPDSDVNDLLCNALNSKYFENLETLRIDEAHHLTSQTICEMIVTAPKLKSMSFGGCPEINFPEFYDIVEFVQENNYDIEIEESYY